MHQYIVMILLYTASNAYITGVLLEVGIGISSTWISIYFKHDLYTCIRIGLS